MADIGKPLRRIVIEPEPLEIPEREPAEPVPAPKREEEPVPA